MEPAKGIISTDDHVVEHPNVWTQRLSKERWGDRIPHLERSSEGLDQWVIDGRIVPLLGSGSAAALMPEQKSEPRIWEEVPPPAHQPAARLAAMDTDGIERSVLYPSVAGVAGEMFAVIEDPDLERDCVRAYNDWLIEEWADASPRFIPQCLVPISSPAAAVAEIRRAVAAGHRGVVFPPVTDQLRSSAHVNEPVWEELWATCEEVAVPICFHAGALPMIEMEPYAAYPAVIKSAMHEIARPACAMGFLSNLLLSHILERHRKLMVVFGESTLGWVNFVIEAVEHNMKQFGALNHVKYEVMPRELMKAQCRFVGWYDDESLRAVCRQFGAESVLWAWNFPAASSDWPHARRKNHERFNRLDVNDRRQMMWENATHLYHLS
jgi:predicted TIM-barrel fold metal-dependent hydrolase